MLDGWKTFDRPSADALRRRIGRHQIRMLGFEVLEVVQQPIEFLVGNLRVVVDVVALFVVTNRFAQFANAVSRRCHRSRDST